MVRKPRDSVLLHVLPRAVGRVSLATPIGINLAIHILVGGLCPPDFVRLKLLNRVENPLNTKRVFSVDSLPQEDISLSRHLWIELAIPNNSAVEA